MNQSFEDWEAVIVLDAPTDGTKEAALAYAARDSRFRIVENAENQRLHMTRLNGVAASTGEWVLFLDSDDEFTLEALQTIDASIRSNPRADALHFCMRVIGVGDTPESAVVAFQKWANQDFEPSEGIESLRSIYEVAEGSNRDWRVTQRVWRGDLARESFSQMSHEKLSMAEDAYECFVMLSGITCEVSIPDLLYVYYYGFGVSGYYSLSAEQFSKRAKAYEACMQAIESFATSKNDATISSCARGACSKLFVAVMTEWMRVRDDDKMTSVRELADDFGEARVSAHLFRHVRDRAYEQLSSDVDWDVVARLHEWVDTAEAMSSSLGGLTEDETTELYKMRAAALSHLKDLDGKRLGEIASSHRDIAIFVTDHKNAVHPRSDILLPVQVGPGLKNNRFSDTLHDDEGENISQLNPYYCELTTQYWAWKNIDSDYYGFCHYRRYFSFVDEAFPENPWGEVMADSIDEEACRSFGLRDEVIRASIDGYDVITTGVKDLRLFPEKFSSTYDHYLRAPHLHVEDIELLKKVIAETTPEYSADTEEFFAQSKSCFCNMFIMRKDIFRDYCEWMFGILDEWMKRADMSLYSHEGQRTPGHLSERLLNIYLMHHRRIGAGWRTKELQCVHFERPEAIAPLQPLLYVSRPVPIVLAANSAYVPQLFVTIDSIARNAPKDRFFDIVVLEHGIPGSLQEKVWKGLSGYANVGVRFVEVSSLIAGHQLKTHNEHISIETYYRFLIQEVLPFYGKALYLDCDLIVRDDVCTLYDMELGDCVLAAARDIDYLGNLNMPDGIRMNYSKEVLGMENPFDYFQAGVLVLNLDEMRKLHTVDEWLQLTTNPDLIYDDQDVLNAECEGRVKFLDPRWNVTTDIFDRVAKVYSWGPACYFDAYRESRKDPAVIHYAGAMKPWNEPTSDFADLYWDLVRDSPFYESFVQTMSREAAKREIWSAFQAHDAVMHAPEPKKPTAKEMTVHRVKQVSTVVAPVGSKRRLALKNAYRRMRGLPPEEMNDAADAPDDGE